MLKIPSVLEKQVIWITVFVTRTESQRFCLLVGAGSRPTRIIRICTFKIIKYVILNIMRLLQIMKME